MSAGGQVALVAGVSGMVGAHIARRLVADGWFVYGLSRRIQHIPEGVRHLPVDLTDKETCKVALSNTTDVTHVFYAIWINEGSEERNCETNRKLVETLIDSLPGPIKHFVLVTGTKHYMGSFDKYGEMKETQVIPFRESNPRLEFVNFYYAQEDVMMERAKVRGFTWSVARPSTIIGYCLGRQMNVGTALAVYASLCKHLERPFTFPGTASGYDVFLDATDADYLAEHVIWQATTASAANQAFNVVNGDVFKWRHLWEAIGNYFGVAAVGPGAEPIDMVATMKGLEATWEEIVKKHHLEPIRLQDITEYWLLNMTLRKTVSCLADMSKSREMGFLRYENTEKAYCRLFDYLKERKIIP